MYDYTTYREDRPFILASVSGWVLFLFYGGCCAYCAWQGAMFHALSAMITLILIMRRLYCPGSMWLVAAVSLVAVVIAAVTLWQEESLTLTFSNLYKLFAYDLFFALFYLWLCLDRRSGVLEMLEEGGRWQYLLYLLLGGIVGMAILFIIDIVILLLFLLMIALFLFGGGSAGRGGSTRVEKRYYDAHGLPRMSAQDAARANEEYFKERHGLK